MPPIDFRSLSLVDALDLAVSIEEEAKERYEQFAKITGGRYAGDAADMFRQMAGNEAKHRAALDRKRRELFGNAPRRIVPEAIDDVEAPDRGAPRTFMSARQAVEVALASELKAHDFYDEALKETRDPSVRLLFEELREEEKRHVTMVGAWLAKLPPGPDVEEGEADEPGSDPG